MAPNILQLQREVEGMPDERLAMEAQGDSPHSLVAVLELSEREQMRNALRNQAPPMPTNTVSDRLIERAMSGIGSIPQQLSPEQEMFARQAMMEMSPEQMMQQQMMMQSPMPQPMADGGLVGYQHGGYHDPDPMAELEVGGLPVEMPPYGPYGASWGRTAADAATLAALTYLTRGRILSSGKGLSRTLSSARPYTQAGQRLRDYIPKLAGIGGIGSLFVGRDRDPVIPDLPEDHPVFQYYGRYDDEDGGHMHSVPSVTQGDVDAALAMSPDEDEGIASLISSMQAPVLGREAMDVSEYYEMTPEEQALLDRARADAQSLESRIDTEADRLSAQANILSNVSRAMARGQVPTAGEPLRELQTAQRSRREGIMDESKAMEMSALAQEAGLSRAEQEALMERAMVEDERGYQEALRQNEIQRFEQYARMSQSEDPNVQEMGVLGLQGMGVTGRDRLTPNAVAEIDNRARSIIDEVVENLDTDNIKSAMDQLNSALGLVYGDQSIPQRVMGYVNMSMLAQHPEEYRAHLSSTLSALGS